MIVRELLTKLGFRVDKKGFDQAKAMAGAVAKGLAGAGLAIGAAIGAVGGFAIKSAGDMEMLTTQFEVMLGSSEKAQAMMKELNNFAASTPFALEDLSKGSQQLLSFGVAEENVIGTMRMLGDTAGGNAEKLNGLVLAYGKVQTKGKASMEEINMMAERGIPIIGTLQDQLGVTEQEFFKMVSAGKIGRDEITQAFQTMTSEGGMFYKGMEKQSQTLQGMISTMKDNFKLLAAELGKRLLPTIKMFVDTITKLVQGPLGELITKIGSGLEPVLKGIGRTLPFLINLFQQIIDVVFKFGGEMADIFKNQLDAKALRGLFAWIPGLLKPVLNVIKSLFKALMPVINLIITQLVTNILPIVVTVLDSVVRVISIISPLIDELIQNLTPLFDRLLPLIQLIITQLVESLLPVLTSAVQLVSRLLPALVPIIEILVTLVEWLTPALLFVVDILALIATAIIDYLIDPFEEFINFIANGMRQIANKLVSVLEPVGEFINNMIVKLVKTLNLIPGVNIPLPDFGSFSKKLQEQAFKIERKKREFVKKSIQNQRVQNINITPKVDIQNTGLKGSDKEASVKAVQMAAEQSFAIQLKKVLVSAGV